MRVLLVSQFYAPEIGATQNRMQAFVDGLVDRGHQVSVIAEQPNHPVGVFHAGFGRRFVMTERGPQHTIRRLWVATSPRKTTASRLAFYGTFALGAGLGVLLARRPDVVLATSPPLPGALAAAGAARLRGVPFVLDVRDLWPAAAEALGEVSDRRAIRVLEAAERWLYRHSTAVTATTSPFCEHIDSVAGRSLSRHVPNGALDALIGPEWPEAPAQPPFVIGYVGNLGIAQGLGIILDAAEQLRDEPVTFAIVGGGPLGDLLASETARRGIDAVELSPPVPVHALGLTLCRCHALVVPLGSHPVLGQFIPSKLYDAMAVGRPVIVAAQGEAADLVTEVGCGVAIAPEDGGALADAIRQLSRDPARAAEMGRRGRAAAPGFSRGAQIDRLEHILASAAGSRHGLTAAG